MIEWIGWILTAVWLIGVGWGVTAFFQFLREMLRDMKNEDKGGD